MARAPEFEPIVVHTGQHYDYELNQQVFEELGVPAPDYELGIGSGTAAEQLGGTMLAFEPLLATLQPTLVVVIGDVNATAACALVARRMLVPVAHVEAGIRSHDETMPEEINRLVTDRLANICYTPDEGASAALQREGVPAERIVFVGNIMVDTLEQHRAAAESRNTCARFGLAEEGYALATLHRPSNVDDAKRLGAWVDLFCDLAKTVPLVLPLHPRTRDRLASMGRLEEFGARPGVQLTEPLGYLDLIHLQSHAALTLTDSGGMQEESCILGTSCLTLRTTTERPLTLRENGGTNELCGHDVELVRRRAKELLARPQRAPFRPPLWDGRTAERITTHMRDWCAGRQDHGPV